MNTNNRNRKKITLNYFLKIFFPILLILILGLLGISKIDMENQKQINNIRQEAQVELIKNNIEKIFTNVLSDIYLLKKSITVTNYFANNSEENTKALESLFFNVAVSKKRYDQVRLLDENGMEVVRINYNKGNPLVVKSEQLQNKKSRYYFQDTKILKENQVYISKFDLNMEDGRVEEPFKPMIRISTPIYDKNDEFRGVLILNYLGENIIKSIDEYEKNNDSFKISLLNQDSYWFKSENKENNWAFMFEGKKDVSLRNSNPDLWKIINSNDKGSVNDKKGIYYYDTIYPFSNIDTNENIEIASDKERYWKIIALYDNHIDLINSYEGQKLKRNISIMALLLALASFIIANILYHKKKNDEQVKLAGEIFQNTDEAILVTDKDTNIIFINKAYENITGYTKEEILGKKTSYFKSGKHDKEFYRTMWEAINKFGYWQGEIWDKKKNGEEYPKWLRINAIRNIQSNEIEYIGVFGDLTDSKLKDQKINKLRNYDILTELPNQNMLNNAIAKRIKLDKENEKKAALLSIKITNFSFISDSLGYEIGSLLILEIGKRIEALLEISIDLLARTGREEFMVFRQSSYDAEEIFDLANKIFEELEKSFLIQNEEIYLTTAMGIALHSQKIEIVDELIRNANIAREDIIKRGENNFQFYNSNIKDKYIEKLKIEKLLRKAIDEDEFILHYQPQIDNETENIVGMEVLLRWESKQLGRVSPDKFIYLAEETGLIIPIGNWVMNEACKQMKKWIDMGYNQLCMAVNISPIQFKNSNVMELLEQNIKKYSLTGENLEIEITESLLLENINFIDKQLNMIKKLGVKIAIDDFGTGYSSLAYLKNLSIDKIKIDRAFVKDYPENDTGVIAKTIVNLAHNLGMKVIAEGVETELQIDWIRELKCDETQGYYYSKPLSADKFFQFLQKGIKATEKPAGNL